MMIALFDADRGRRLLIAAVLTLTPAVLLQAEPNASFAPIPGVPGDNPFGSHAIGITGDGSTVFGEVRGLGQWEAMTWTRGGGTRAHGAGVFLGGSRDGFVMVGHDADHTAARWSLSTGWTAIPTVPGGDPVVGLDISPDASTIVGYADADRPEFRTRAVIWRAGQGTQAIPALMEGQTLYAQRVSADGATVVGTLYQGASDAWRWTAATGTQYLDPERRFSTLTDMSPDAAFIVGGTQNRTEAGWLLRSDGSRLLIPNPLGANGGSANGVSDDGSVIVGTTVEGAYIWDAVNGTRYLSSVLESYGVSLQGFRLKSAVEISGDGLTIIGTGRNAQGLEQSWIATIPAPSTCLMMAAAVVPRRRRNSF